MDIGTQASIYLTWYMRWASNSQPTSVFGPARPPLTILRLLASHYESTSLPTTDCFSFSSSPSSPATRRLACSARDTRPRYDDPGSKRSRRPYLSRSREPIPVYLRSQWSSLCERIIFPRPFALLLSFFSFSPFFRVPAFELVVSCPRETETRTFCSTWILDEYWLRGLIVRLVFRVDGFFRVLDIIRWRNTRRLSIKTVSNCRLALKVRCR